MSLASKHPPLTLARIEQLARAGHDDFEPPLNALRARQLVESVREHVRAQREIAFQRGIKQTEEWLGGPHAAANATLAAIRGYMFSTQADSSYAVKGQQANRVRDLLTALASQPEAPLRNGPSDADSMPVCVPEAPKVPAAEADPHGPDHGEADPDYPPHAHAFTDAGPSTRETLLSRLSELERNLAAANARIAELELDRNEWMTQHENLLAMYQASVTDIAAANARIAELEARLVIGPRNSDEVQIYIEEGIKVETQVCRHERDLANARADAAEWKYLVEARTVNELTAERDQLAARVKWLEARWEESDYCTTAERNVLDACKQSEIHPGTPGISDPCINRGEWRIAAAELANRAAKAKRAPDGGSDQ